MRVACGIGRRWQSAVRTRSRLVGRSEGRTAEAGWLDQSLILVSSPNSIKDCAIRIAEVPVDGAPDERGVGVLHAKAGGHDLVATVCRREARPIRRLLPSAISRTNQDFGCQLIAHTKEVTGTHATIVLRPETNRERYGGDPTRTAERRGPPFSGRCRRHHPCDGDDDSQEQGKHDDAGCTCPTIDYHKPFLMAAFLAHQQEAVSTQDPHDLIGVADREMLAHGRPTSRILAPAGINCRDGSNQSSRASFALATASASVSPAEAHPGSSGKNAAQRLVSASCSTTNRSFIEDRVRSSR